MKNVLGNEIGAINLVSATTTVAIALSAVSMLAGSALVNKKATQGVVFKAEVDSCIFKFKRRLTHLDYLRSLLPRGDFETNVFKDPLETCYISSVKAEAQFYISSVIPAAVNQITENEPSRFFKFLDSLELFPAAQALALPPGLYQFEFRMKLSAPAGSQAEKYVNQSRQDRPIQVPQQVYGVKDVNGELGVVYTRSAITTGRAHAKFGNALVVDDSAGRLGFNLSCPAGYVPITCEIAGNLREACKLSSMSNVDACTNALGDHFESKPCIFNSQCTIGAESDKKYLSMISSCDSGGSNTCALGGGDPPPSVGACEIGASCSLISSVACGAAGGDYQGDGTSVYDCPNYDPGVCRIGDTACIDATDENTCESAYGGNWHEGGSC